MVSTVDLKIETFVGLRVTVDGQAELYTSGGIVSRRVNAERHNDGLFGTDSLPQRYTRSQPGMIEADSEPRVAADDKSVGGIVWKEALLTSITESTCVALETGIDNQ